VALQVHISEAARAQLDALPGSTAERLANHLKAIAELADLQPILYSGEEVRMLNLHVGDFHVRYSVDTASARVVVNEIRRAAGPGSAP
jgi:mRNA-degrading endonuclease RelE of RelBE toxin-antitoxin system